MNEPVQFSIRLETLDTRPEPERNKKGSRSMGTLKRQFADPLALVNWLSRHLDSLDRGERELVTDIVIEADPEEIRARLERSADAGAGTI